MNNFPVPSVDPRTGLLPAFVRRGTNSHNGRFNPHDYRATETDPVNVSAIQAAVTAASEAGGGIVSIPSGDYDVTLLDVPNFVTVRADSGEMARFGGQVGAGQRAAVRFLRPAGNTDAYQVRLSGAGAALENILIDGGGKAGTGLITSGFETRIDTVRVMNCAGIGFDVQKANNARWNNIYVDNCGTKTLPAVNIWSKAGVGSANETNNVAIYGLTIERCANGALDIAYGTTAEHWAEWIKIFDLHVEAPSDNGGTPNTDALIRIGNIRNVSLFAPMIYGGPGVLLRHEQRVARAVGNGGIRVFGGSFLGSDTNAGANPTPNLVQLVTGDDTAFEGVVFMRHTGPAIDVASTYGAKFFVSPSSTFTGVALADARSLGTTVIRRGHLTLTDHFLSTGAAPTVTNAQNGTGAPTPRIDGTDVAGRVFFGTGTGTISAEVPLASVTFARKFETEPTVHISPANAATAKLQVYAARTPTGFTIRAVGVPATGLPFNGLQVTYSVDGFNN